MTPDQQIRTRNREMCERILRRNVPKWTIELLSVPEAGFLDTPFDVLAALAWAYQEIDRLEGER
jgi:hypothetical protein